MVLTAVLKNIDLNLLIPSGKTRAQGLGRIFARHRAIGSFETGRFRQALHQYVPSPARHIGDPPKSGQRARGAPTNGIDTRY